MEKARERRGSRQLMQVWKIDLENLKIISIILKNSGLEAVRIRTKGMCWMILPGRIWCPVEGSESLWTGMSRNNNHNNNVLKYKINPKHSWKLFRINNNNYATTNRSIVLPKNCYSKLNSRSIRNDSSIICRYSNHHAL